MSTDDIERQVGDPPSLSYWIPELVAAADLDPMGAGARLRSVVGSHRARIALDDDSIDVEMRGRRVRVEPPHDTRPVDGVGSTTSEVVLALLDGRLEVSDAIHHGAITATGSRGAIALIFGAIEILLDASSRVPRFRELADQFDRAARGRGLPDAWVRIPDRSTPPEEYALLARLGLNGSGPR